MARKARLQGDENCVGEALGLRDLLQEMPRLSAASHTGLRPEIPQLA